MRAGPSRPGSGRIQDLLEIGAKATKDGVVGWAGATAAPTGGQRKESRMRSEMEGAEPWPQRSQAGVAPGRWHVKEVLHGRCRWLRSGATNEGARSSAGLDLKTRRIPLLDESGG